MQSVYFSALTDWAVMSVRETGIESTFFLKSAASILFLYIREITESRYLQDLEYAGRNQKKV